MVFFVSYPFIYLLTSAKDSLHEILRNECMWGGPSKPLTMNGLDYHGYEFRDGLNGKYYSKHDHTLAKILVILEDEQAVGYVKPKPELQVLYRLLYIKIHPIVAKAQKGELEWSLAFNTVFTIYGEWSIEYKQTIEWYDPKAGYDDDVLAFYNHVKTIIFLFE